MTVRLILPGRRLAMHLMVQPNVAALFLADGLLAEQGLLSRVLGSSPESTIGARCWHEASADSELAIKAYGKRLLDILEMPLPLAERKRNELAPRAISLSSEARASWIAFHDHVEVQMGEGEPLWPIRGLANKLPEIVGRLAGVLALVDHIEATTEIGTTEVERGIALASTMRRKRFGCSRRVRRMRSLYGRRDSALAHHGMGKRRCGPARDLPARPEFRARHEGRQGARSPCWRSHGDLVRIEGGAVVGEQNRRDAWRIVGRKTDQ